MKMKKHVAILMLLCAVLFALPTGAMAATLDLKRANSNGQFDNAVVTDTSEYVVVTGDLAANIILPSGYNSDTTRSGVNFFAFRVGNENGQVSNIQDFIRAIQFANPENARIYLLDEDDLSFKNASNTNTAIKTHFYPTNRHFYRYYAETENVNSSGSNDNDVTWNEARGYAKDDRRKFLNRTGYLVTVYGNETVGSAENSFIASLFNSSNMNITTGSAWLGGMKETSAGNQVDNGWIWADGPDAGRKFYNMSVYSTHETDPTQNVVGSSYVTDDNVTIFHKWANKYVFSDYPTEGTREPNNSGQMDGTVDKENATHMYLETSQVGYWNDLPNSSTDAAPTGYIVEYGDNTDDDKQEHYHKLKLVTYIKAATDPSGYTYCDNSDEDYYTIDFAYGHGADIDLPELPDTDGYKFDGWYTSKEAAYNKNTANQKTVYTANASDFDVSKVNTGVETVYYARWIKNVSGEIEWQDFNDYNESRPLATGVTLTLKEDGTAKAGYNTSTSPSITLNGNTWSYEYTGVPAYSAAGALIEHGIAMDDVANYSKNQNGMNFTLSRGITGSVTWEDGDNRDGIRENQTLTLYADGAVVGAFGVSKPSTDTNGTVNFTIPQAQFDTSNVGAGAVYSVGIIDDHKTDDYTYSGPDTSNAFDLIHEPEKITVQVVVNWDVQAEATKNPVTGTLSNLSENNAISLNETGGWTQSFANLFRKHRVTSEGNTTSEVIPYAANLSATGYTLTKDTANSKYDESIKTLTLTYTATAQKHKIILNTIGALESAPEGYTGSDGTYSREVDYSLGSVPEGTFVYSGQPDWKFGGWYTDMTYETEVTEDTIGTATADVNLYARWNRNIDVSVTWDDENNYDNLRAANSITVSGTDGDSQTREFETTDVQTLNFIELRVHDSSKEVVNYLPTITNPLPTGYTMTSDPTLEETNANAASYAIKLSHVPNKTDVGGTITWNDNEDQDGKRHEMTDLVIKVYNGDALLMDSSNEAFEIAEDSSDTTGKTWRYAFKDLYEKAGNQGDAIEYWVELILPANTVYTDSTTYEDGKTKLKHTGTGANFSLSYTPEALTITTVVEWGGSNQNAPRPGVTITLDDVNESVVLPNGEAWSKEVSGLPRYGNGTLIDYANASAVLDEVSENPNANEGYTLVDPNNQGYTSRTVDLSNNITYTFRYEPNSYDLILDAKYDPTPDNTENDDKVDGTYQTNPESTYTYGEEYVIPNPSVLGQTFTGWQDAQGNKLPFDANGTVIPADQIGNLSLKATYSDIPYTIRYVLYDGTEPTSANPTSYTYYDAPEITDPSHPDEYKFDGWYSDNTFAADKKIGWRIMDESGNEPVATQTWTFDPAQVIADGLVKLEKDESSQDINVIELHARWLTDVTNVSAKWDDRNNQDGRRQDVDVVLYAKYENPEDSTKTLKIEKDKLTLWANLTKAAEDAEKNGAVVTTDADGNKTVVHDGVTIDLKEQRVSTNFTDLDAYIAGKEVEYVTQAELVIAKINHVYKALVDDPSNAPHAYRLHHDQEENIYNLMIQWNDDNDAWKIRPTEIQVELYVEKGEFSQPPIEELTPTLMHPGWSTSWNVQINPDVKAAPVPLNYNVRLLTKLPSAYVVSSNTYDAATRTRTMVISHKEKLLPPTGDESSIALWGGLLALCVSGLGWMALRRRSSRA